MTPAPTVTSRRQLLEALLETPLVEAARTDAHYVLWEVCLAEGDARAAADHLARAMSRNPIRTRHAAAAAPRRSVLLLAAPGDFQANCPVDLLLGADTRLHTLRLADPDAVLARPSSAFGGRVPPPFEAVMIVIAEDASRHRHLAAADALARQLGRPVLNDGAAIARLSRDGAAALLADLPDALVPVPQACARAELRDTAPPFPFLLRPAGSHAGRALNRVAAPGDLQAALGADRDTASFYATPFVDYRSADGLYRKVRIVFVGGAPYPVHLAIHDDWAVWYYNAAMDRFAERRAEEAAFLACPEAVLGPRAMRALAHLADRVGLDYFGVDCARLPDGRLLVFEIETGMIVHDRDDAGLFAAKNAAARRVASALETLIDRRIASTKR